ncbi:ParB N-terminal domain-containing protein [Streptomyces sp. NPDC006530]|uniref:ParB N-terminal domain-containing protein n=1 Tax=Streptomyces sp. NPDC006530 TaxID=3364750 RepID=UPI0036865658
MQCNANSSVRSRRDDAVKIRNITLADIKHDHRVRGLGDLEKLANSIDRNRLLQPVVMRNDGVTLVSGLRRLHACSLLGLSEISALIPSDVVELASALQRETDRADPETDLPMTLRERMDLAYQIHCMPTPSSKVSHSIYASDVVGIPNRTYWRIRAVMNLAKEGVPNPPFSAIRARKLVRLMLDAVENPPAGWSPSRIIEELHRLRDKGDIPETITCMNPRRRSLKERSEPDAQPAEPRLVGPRPTPTRAAFLPSPSRRTPEVSRAVASLVGVCAGISYITEIKTSSDEDLAHWDHELRDCKKHINALHALIRKAHHV